MDKMEPDNSHRQDFMSRLKAAAGITLFILFLLLICWYAVDVLLLVFAAILLAIFLRGLSDWLSEFTKFSANWSFAIVVLLLASGLGLGSWLLAPAVTEQVDELVQGLPRAAHELQQYIERFEWGRRILAQAPSAGQLLFDRADVLTRATGVLSTSLGTLTNVLIVLFIGFYLAVEPKVYRSGIVRLVPKEHRRRADEILSAIGATLRRWLVGRAILMLVNACLTALGLWLLGVPLALTLGILAGLLNFVPNLGPLIAAIPAVLIALMQSPTQAFYVLLLYLILQSVDGYVFTPLVQRRTVSLPPALTISAQVLLGVLLGNLGVLLATPLTAAALVFVRMLYIEDILGDYTGTQEEAAE